MTDSNVVARRIGTVHRVLVASPSYVAQAGAPVEPADLVDRAIIVGPAGKGTEGWSFHQDGKKATVRIQGRFFIDSTESATAAVVAGLGIFSTGQRSIQAELQSGALVRLLPNWTIGAADIHVLLPAGRASKVSARAFADFIATQVRDIETAFPWNGM